jgi:hypothetical protein
VDSKAYVRVNKMFVDNLCCYEHLCLNPSSIISTGDGEVVDAIMHTMICSFFFDVWMILREKLLMPSCTQ